MCVSQDSGGIEPFLCNMLTRLDMTWLEVDAVVAQQGSSVFTVMCACSRDAATFPFAVDEMSGWGVSVHP